MERRQLLIDVFRTMFVIVVASAGGSSGHNSNQDFVDAHNEVRAQVGVGPMVWNDTVAAYAQKYANERVHDCNQDHSGGPYGENLASGHGEMSAAEAVKFWETEKADYDYNGNKCKGDDWMGCFHYTQMVWRKSVHLGCASVKCDNGWVFVICNYDPPGNIVGDGNCLAEKPY